MHIFYGKKDQKELLAAVEHNEQAVRKAEQENIDLKIFLEAIRECTYLKELSPTVVNTLIKQTEVCNSEKGAAREGYTVFYIATDL